jgi:hypothetical protein
MSGERSPYDVLGLRPGAPRAEVNDAYRKLMKRHHPDRPGGDSNRAAEINRAYTYLRRRLGEPVRIPVPVPVPRRSRRGGWKLLLAFAVAVAGLSAMLLNGDDRQGFSRDVFVMVPQFSAPGRADAGESYDPPLASLDEPVQAEVVAKAIADAVGFHTSGDLAGAADFSDECQKALRRERTLGWFDTCAAFDETMLTLNNGGPDDPGPFNESAVITREVSAARIFSDRSLSVDSHLHDIRSQVDMAVLPMLDSAAGVKP